MQAKVTQENDCAALAFATLQPLLILVNDYYI